MLDRQVVKEFLENKLTDWNTLPPPNLDFDKLVEVFCLYVEEDYYEWLEENSRSFFYVVSDKIDWDAIVGKIEKYQVK